MLEITLDDLLEADLRLTRRLASEPSSLADVAALVRTGLVARGDSRLRMPADLAERWSADAWSRHGLTYDGTSLTALRWLPPWLDHHGTAPDEAPSHLTPRRINALVPADPFYARTSHFATSKTLGQRDALRIVAVAEPGDTVICILPTASGKTDVVLTRALRERPRQSVVIVPTVSLAIDLERRVQSWLGVKDRFAYHASLDPMVKGQISNGIADGNQWLTIASPEAVCTRLALPLRAAAERGSLGLIALDEAHIVAEWGDEFRPAFQIVAGLRGSLVEASPQYMAPTTVLLTGTLDAHGLTTLRRLFSGRSEVVISAQATRPEPAWWSASCVDEKQKRDRLIEALANLPRPALVYTTLHTSSRSSNPATVLSWLKAAGFKAVDTVASHSSVAQRQAAIQGLRLAGDANGDLDIVVATSAFGLGIDIDDIRTVIHLCVPESVDRLYQEVGRSGRDGRATASLVLWTENDEEIANQIARARLIGPDLAWKRWRSMRAGATGARRLPVSLTAAHDTVTYPWRDANRYWNTQTLAGMERAGMIRRHWPEPSEVPAAADEDELASFFDAERTTAAIEVLDSDIADERVFRQRFQQGQRTSRLATSAAFDAATRLLHGTGECTNQYIARRYELTDGNGNVLPVAIGCGGCPHCRRAGRRPHAAAVFDSGYSGYVTRQSDEHLQALSPDGRLSVRNDGLDRRAEQVLLSRLVRHGLIALVTPRREVGIASTGGEGLWWVDEIREWSMRIAEPWRVPTLLWIDETVDDDLLARALVRLSRQPLGVLMAPPQRPDPRNPKQSLHDAWMPAYWIEDLLRRL